MEKRTRYGKGGEWKREIDEKEEGEVMKGEADGKTAEKGNVRTKEHEKGGG